MARLFRDLNCEPLKPGWEQEKLTRQLQRKIEEVIEASLKNGAAKPVN